MTAGVDLERRLVAWFEQQAPGHAPDRVLSVALDAVAVTPQRRSLGRRVGWAWAGLSRQQRRLLLVVATLGIVTGGLVVGALLVQQLPRPPDLVVVRADGTFPDPVGVTVQRVRPDGSTEVIASWSADELGGSYADGAGVALSPAGYLAIPVSTGNASEYRIVDLRDPDTPPRTPDAEAMFGAWSGDDRFAMPVNAGGIVAYDAHTGISTAASAPNVGPRDVMFRPVWASDGSGVHANGVPVGTGGFGVLRLDGSVVEGAEPEVPTGVGPRRTAPDGTRIQCIQGEDYGCEDGYTITRYGDDDATELFVDDRPDVRIADFAVTADGTGLWILLETVAPGPRTVTLVSRAADGTERLVATFDGEADDPDEGSYFAAASLAAMAPDDSRLVLAFAGPGGSFGPRVAIDPETGAQTRLEGAPAGWITGDTLTRPRPPAELIAEADPAIRGVWAAILPERVGAIPEGVHQLTIRRTSADLDAGFGEIVTLALAADGPDGVVLRQRDARLGCQADSSARYRWRVEAGLLRLEASEDACAARRLLLEEAFEPALPLADTGSKPLAGGSRYFAATFPVPFRLTIPDGGLASGSGSTSTVSLSRSEVDDSGSVTIAPVRGGGIDPCDRFTIGAPFTPGLQPVVDYVEGLADAGATVERLPDTTIDGRAGPTFRLTAPSTCDRGLALFAGESRMTTVEDGTIVTIVEVRPGEVVAIAVRPGTSGDDAWLAPLLDSIDFLD